MNAQLLEHQVHQSQAGRQHQGILLQTVQLLGLVEHIPIRIQQEQAQKQFILKVARFQILVKVQQHYLAKRGIQWN